MNVELRTKTLDNHIYNRFISLARAAGDGFRSIALPAEGESHIVGGVWCWRSASSVPVFNGALLLTSEDITGGTLHAVRAYFEGREYSVMTLDALVPNSHNLLAGFGYTEYDTLPAMWLEQARGDLLMQHRGRMSGELRVMRVESSAELAAYRAIVGGAFGLPAGEINSILSNRALHVPHTRHYLAWWGDMPVGTVSLVLAGEVAGVWNVGTLTAYRRRGIGMGMVRHVLSEARTEGYNQFMLLSSTEGLSLYARLGFTTLSTLRVFVPE